MDIVVHDTPALLQPLFTARLRPSELFARAEGVVRDLVSPAARKHRDRGGYGVMQAGAQDGFDVMFAQQVWGLFNPTRRREASAWVFDRFSEAGVLETAGRWLRDFAERLPLPAAPPRVEFFLVPADPANRSLMAMNHGVSAFGGVPGYLFLQLWPSAGNLRRLGPVLARIFAHNLRWSAAPAPPQGAALADFLALEGLAAAFAEGACPELDVEPWAIAARPTEDWEAALAHVAEMYGVAAFDDIQANIYGSKLPMGPGRAPLPVPLAADEAAYARGVLAAGLAATDVRAIAAHLYGDELVAAQGHATVGLPPYAGFEIAYRAVRGYLDRTQRPLAEAFALPSAELLAGAGWLPG